MSRDTQSMIAQLMRMSEEAAKAKAQVQAMLAPSDAALRRAVAQIAQMEEVSRRFARQIAPAMREIERALFTASRMKLFSKVWDARQRHAAAILAERGWCLSPDFSLPLLNSVIRMKEDGRGRQINRMICDYYGSRRLSKLVDKWMEEPLLKRRQRPLQEALRAHKQKRWLLSIPVLLAQEEGILRDYAEKLNLPKKESVKTLARALKARTADATLVSDTWLAQFDEIFKSGFHSTKRTVVGLRRNAILHGLEIHYGSELRSLQLFLQMETIHWLISEKPVSKAA